MQIIVGVFLILLFHCNVLASNEEFYVFDVGQGNSQLAIYKKSNIGVLYDCGSSSSKIHPKIEQLKKTEEWKLFFKKRQKIILPLPKKDITGKKDFLFEEEEIKKESSLIDESSISSQPISVTDSSTIKTNKFINEVIGDAKLLHLFVILSHPDRDHINFINDETIPEYIPITVFLAGDWLGKGGSNSKETGLSADVTKVLNFLRERKNTWVEFPYYWNGFKTTNKEASYTEIKDMWQKDYSENFATTYKLCSKGTIRASLEFLNLYQSLDKILSKNHNKDKIFYQHFENLDISFDTNDYYYNSYVIDDLKNVKIAHINIPFKDVNSQSTVVEIKMPQLKMQFYLTGDVHEETLELISVYNQHELFFQKEAGFISLVMLPHHGSYENQSINISALFKPDIFGISAGNGGAFSHPSKKLIREMKKDLKEAKRKTSFYDLFEESDYKNNFIYFDEIEKSNTRLALLHKHKKQSKNGLKTPFFCTNLLGTIKVDEEGFKSYFSNIIENNDSTVAFLVDYTNRVTDPDLLSELSKKNSDDMGIVKYKDSYYYLVVDKKKNGFYYKSTVVKEPMGLE